MTLTEELRASAAPQEPPHGWVLVPREPQPQMMRTILQSLYDASGADFDATEPEAYAVYRAIVAAAPQPQAPSATSDDVRGFEGLATCVTCGQDMTGSDAAEITRLQAALADARDKAQTADARDAELLALKMADRLCKEALPKFNWGASALDANAIKLLNEVPGLISAAIQGMLI